MSSKTRRGDKFYYAGKPWVCLEVNKKSVLALRLSDLHTEVMGKRSARARCGKQYTNLIKSVDDLVMKVGPGVKLITSSGVMTVKKAFASGDLICEDEEGRPSRISKWRVAGSFARLLLSNAKLENNGHQEGHSEPLPSTPKESDSDGFLSKVGRAVSKVIRSFAEFTHKWARVLRLNRSPRTRKEDHCDSCNAQG